jgi:aminocarboxymuconate-semialdehyde decarboxylase
VVIDMHAHYVPNRLIKEIQTSGKSYGVKVQLSSGGRPIYDVGGFVARPVRAELSDFAARKRDLAKEGVDRQIQGAWMDLTGYSLPAEEGARWTRLQNEAMAEEIQAAGFGDTFVGLAGLPLQDPGRAAAELEHCVGKLGFRGAMIATNVNGMNYDDPRFDPVWRVASQAKVPIVLHPFNTVAPDRLTKHFLSNSLGNPLDTTIAAATMIYGGVCDRFPDLKVVLVHAGGFLPWIIGRLEQSHRHAPTGKGGMAKPPLDYLRWFYYDTIIFHLPMLKFLVEMVGADRVVLGSDDPFDMQDFDMTQIVKKAGLSAGDQTKILETNIRSLFGI